MNKAFTLAFLVGAVTRTANCQPHEPPANSIPCIVVNEHGQSTATIAWNGPDDEWLAEAVAWRTAHQGRLRLPRLGEILAVAFEAQQAGLDPNDLRGHPWADVYVVTPERMRLGRLGVSGVAFISSVSGHIRDPAGKAVADVLVTAGPNISTATTDANGFYWVDIPWGQ